MKVGIHASIVARSGDTQDGKLSSMPFDAILYDFDGLVADTESAWYETWRDTLAGFGGTLDPTTYAACIGTVGLEPEDELASLIGRDALPGILQNLDQDALRRCRNLRPRPGVEALIRECDDQGLHRAIVSSSQQDWIEELLDVFGLSHGWSRVVCADGDRGIAKPSPHLYLRAIRELEVEPARALALEDSPNGIRSAKDAGLRCVAVPNPLTASLDLSEADLILPSLEGVTLADLSSRLA